MAPAGKSITLAKIAMPNGDESGYRLRQPPNHDHGIGEPDRVSGNEVANKERDIRKEFV